MKINIGKWCFSPGLITSLLTLIFFSLFVSLGFWQLDRAEQKRVIYRDFENRQSAEAIVFDQDHINSLGIEEIIWRHVKAAGEFQEQYQILLDNQVEKGQAGYFVYTPFQLRNGKHSVLVNKGWVPTGTDRAVSPDLKLTDGPVRIKGVVKKEPKTGVLLKEAPPEIMAENIYRVQKIDLDELSELTSTILLPYIIRLEPESEHGYLREWRLPGSGESVNIGYAFQWFAFAATLLVIYLVINIKRTDKTEENE